ncbi:GNAT family N-acetyltransferase [Acinetobacter sp. NIPH 1852]|uniref:GNAT family N-acetyltransferase n=1 Tax=Acinetobacter sp. NIPH 1852 TaxID=2923428 RepID=UPI001F4B32AD|nr:GNAT family N-acetyltransferase [Acinetobacter sp. NIPH 1852]MCH7308552.1 GNAT family N-acetyltransferase [Acinetobacter sp. NIPH 1852]
MKIVEYNDKFKDDVIDLILSIQNIEFDVGIPLAEQPDIQDIHKYFITSGGNFWLALDQNDKLIGTIGLQALTPQIAILKKFFVISEYRGHQVGMALYNELLKFAEINHFLEIFLDTPAKATQSHKFYRKAGFKEVAKELLPVVYQYPDRDSLIFHLKL